MTESAFDATRKLTNSSNTTKPNEEPDLFQRMAAERGNSGYDWFNRADRDSDRRLSQTELRFASRDQSLTPAEREFISIVSDEFQIATKVSDPNNKGGLSKADVQTLEYFQQFRTAANKDTEATKTTALANFDKFDVDKDGAIERKDLKKLTGSLEDEARVLPEAKEQLRAAKDLQDILSVREVVIDSDYFRSQPNSFTREQLAALTPEDVAVWKQKTYLADRVREDYGGINKWDLLAAAGGAAFGYFVGGEKGAISGASIAFTGSRKINSADQNYYAAQDAMKTYDGYQSLGINRMLRKFDSQPKPASIEFSIETSGAKLENPGMRIGKPSLSAEPPAGEVSKLRGRNEGMKLDSSKSIGGDRYTDMFKPRT